MVAVHLPFPGVPPVGSSRPTDGEVRRAVVRAEAGKSLDTSEVAALLASTGEHLDRLMAVAARVRDAGLAAVGRSGVVTFSPKVFVPVTRLCRDRCHYCTFVATPGQLERDGQGLFLSVDEVLEICRAGAGLGCTEALFTLGDRPEDRWPEAKRWLAEAGYDSTLEYVRALAVRVLEETGLLPHLNPGVMSWAEMNRLKPVAPSMGMMLETTSERLFTEKGQPHHGSPDKDPAVRLRVLEDAGRLGIPFTTGILVGIGETWVERAESLFAIRRVHREHGSIQEVIVQNFRAKDATAMRSTDDLGVEEYLAAVATARVVLGPGVRVQAPPNLVDLAECGQLLAAGVDDFGGISPVTPDHVNPERPWPQIDALRGVCEAGGFDLRPRLTTHPELLDAPWVDPRLRPHVDALRGPDGLLADGVRPVGLPWQEPDGGLVTSGRSDLHASIDTTGRRADRRGDFDEVYGDWDTIGARVPAAPERLAGDVAAALRAAERDPAGLTEAQALALMTADGPGLEAVCALADDLRRDTVGDTVTYVVNRNINFTNICYTGCRFCAFAQRATDADAYSLSTDEIADRVREAVAVGATEVCVQGGIDPSLPGTVYADIARTIKAAGPDLHLHAYSPMEVMNGVARTGLSITEFLHSLAEAGVDSLPGTAAEILDDDVRWVLTKGKLPASQWIEVVRTAHTIGLPTTATMMYGHVDHPGHWVTHLKVIADLQRDTGGFTEFVPLPFVHQSSPIYLAGVARPGPTVRDNRAVHAMARIMLHGLVDNIQCSWVKLGPDQCTQVLNGGVNDLGGTLMEETISRMAGSTNGSRKEREDLEAMAHLAGRPARQRTTTYGRLPAASPA
ncbi:7,8-didemethyl-8-hydroxy-5-deazariboflavin synthase, CofH subunit [Aeromicrobium marinum DSM 15272]|uniref:FO synthase n=1 Tax=Aeromicrobium marinum DSM 15272 TaxID=585531 RepID=E2SFM8_9ACTN|nr:bifunctional FO biosynthesis protein CofGH [Aeromicrobium marinum]EFQ81995.1 7,8-didemethyl-8-hydroxy-5-deazariboflavin synthase, CofH subunit [Aeromicrobium marinum DSM 15272]